MSRGFRENSGRAVCLLAVFDLLVIAVSGCGDAPRKEEGASPIPANVQESNKTMQDFMKSQNAKAKK